MNSAPSCPIRIALESIDDPDSLQDQCLTAHEIEWRRWSTWQQERTARKRLKKLYSVD
ncbi:hypothetical protein SynA15127_02020 [Synechococcus sp. A15-127]|nr:hypothetical protein SynA15127_02020 [Synechococcus sp. A15-127]